MKLSLWFISPRKQIYGVGFEVSGHPGGSRGRGAHPGEGRSPHSCGQGVGPLTLILSLVFFINSEKLLRGFFRSFRELLFLHKNNTMAVLLKTAAVRVSCIHITQGRVPNKGKSVWTCRYDGDVSTPPSLNLCLSSSNSVDKLKVIKKNFYKLCLHLLL